MQGLTGLGLLATLGGIAIVAMQQTGDAAPRHDDGQFTHSVDEAVPSLSSTSYAGWPLALRR